MGKHKRAGSKHRLAGPIGRPVTLDINSSTTEKESKLGLQRNKAFAFAPPITVIARSVGNEKEEREATFSRAIFQRSLGGDLFFRGEPITKKNRGGQIMSFCISENTLRSRIVLETKTSLGEVVEGEG